MAAADYRWCDGCDSKAFYDAELHYDFDAHPGSGLYNVGEWVVLCRKCVETHRIAIVPRAVVDGRNVRDALLEAGFSTEQVDAMLAAAEEKGSVR